MMDTLLYYYARSTTEPYTEPLTLRILDSEGASVAYMQFAKPIMNSINELNLNFSDNISEFSTFEINFYYNQLKLRIELD